MNFTELEKKVIKDKEFLITKTEVIKKIEILFEEVRNNLNKIIINSGYHFNPDIDIKYGKIFRGENYRLLPYVNLDYPKLFSNKNIFSFRTMFWWGNFISSTLHLEGESLQQYKNKISKNSQLLIDYNVFVSVNNDTPWEYHYQKDNYAKLNNENKFILQQSNFLKLSKKFSIEDLENIPKYTAEYFQLILKVLNN